MKKILILTALKSEIIYLINLLNAQNIKSSTVKNLFQKDNIYLGVVGLGMIDAALNTQIYLNYVKPDNLFFIGTCAAISNNLSEGDLVIPENIINGESGFIYKNHFHPVHYSKKPFISNNFKPNTKYHITVNKIISDKKYIENFIKKFPYKIESLDMEAWSVLYTAHKLNMKTSLIKIVSDLCNIEIKNIQKNKDYSISELSKLFKYKSTVNKYNSYIKKISEFLFNYLLDKKFYFKK